MKKYIKPETDINQISALDTYMLSASADNNSMFDEISNTKSADLTSGDAKSRDAWDDGLW